MFISEAFAQGVNSAAAVPAPSPVWNLGLLAVMVVLFYVLLIMPQQKRFKEHAKLLGGLVKGDRVVTGGGLVGTVDKVINDDELMVDLGGGVKVTAMRSSITGKTEAKPANDAAPKKAAAKKAAPKKKAPAKKK